MVAGGLLTALGWRWVFFAPVVASALILAAAIALVRDSGVPERVRGGFDLPGAFSVTGSMLLLVYGVRAGYPLGQFWTGIDDPKLHVLRLTPWRIQVIRGGDLHSRIWKSDAEIG
jgi:hypothetical protein